MSCYKTADTQALVHGHRPAKPGHPNGTDLHTRMSVTCHYDTDLHTPPPTAARE